MKVIPWALVALYTFILPDVIIVYRAIVDSFGKAAAGKIPVVMVVIVGIAYGAAVRLSHRSWKNLLFLIPSGVIAFLIIKLVSNPNKHIHIPEYILMTWLLLAALSADHKGKGLLILVFVYASLLGVVDELEQGIHPARFYGLSDMLVNSASALIGVFTIMGLKKITATDWAWTSRLKEFRMLLGLGVFGLLGAVIMCDYLLQVQASGVFWDAYPVWLWAWNLLFLVLTPALILHYRGTLRKPSKTRKRRDVLRTESEMKTAQAWIVPMLVILFYMHALVVFVSIPTLTFE